MGGCAQPQLPALAEYDPCAWAALRRHTPQRGDGVRAAHHFRANWSLVPGSSSTAASEARSSVGRPGVWGGAGRWASGRAPLCAVALRNRKGQVVRRCPSKHAGARAARHLPHAAASVLGGCTVDASAPPRPFEVLPSKCVLDVEAQHRTARHSLIPCVSCSDSVPYAQRKAQGVLHVRTECEVGLGRAG